MVANEGVRRLRALGKLLLLGGFGSAIILAGSLYLLPSQVLPLILLVYTVPLMLLGAAIWIGAWVLEGFLARQ